MFRDSTANARSSGTGRFRLVIRLVMVAVLAGLVPLGVTAIQPARAAVTSAAAIASSIPTNGTSSNGCLDLGADFKVNLFYEYWRVRITGISCDGYQVRMVVRCVFQVRNGVQTTYSYGRWIDTVGDTSRGRCSSVDSAFPELEFRYVGPI